jgi:hypothetical protein
MGARRAPPRGTAPDLFDALRSSVFFFFPGSALRLSR